MSISSALQGALSGLKATQAGIDVVSQNVANAGSVGYTRRVLTTTAQLSGTQTTGVNVVGAERVLDSLVQRQLRLENAGASYTGVKATYHGALDAMFDAPGATGSLPNLVNGLSSAIGGLVTNPSSYGSQTSALSAASDLASSLNSLSGQVQSLRQDTEDALARSVTKASGLLGQIATLSGRMANDPANAASPGLQDARDGLIDQLSQLMDLKVTQRDDGRLSISTTGGLQLFDGLNAATLSFDGRSAVRPQSAWDPDPTVRSLGTITATDAAGRTSDVLATGGIRSGEIAAYLELRDQVLPTAQAQLDALAAGLASALSDKPVPGTAVTSGAASGYDLDLSSLQNGNTLTVSLTSGGAARTVSFVKTGSAAAAARATGNGAVGIDFSGGMASVASQISAKLGSGFTVSASGSTLRILDDGAAGTTDVSQLSGSATVTALASGDAELAVFTDGATPYTGSFETGIQLTGFASRISVSAALKANIGALVKYGPATLAGDTARPERLLAALTSQGVAFSGKAAIGGSSAPFTGTVSDFATRIVASQAADAASAASLDSGQKVVLNTIQGRLSDQSGVNIDTEMTQLIQLQTAYGANARVMSAAKEMLDMLMRVGA